MMDDDPRGGPLRAILERFLPKHTDVELDPIRAQPPMLDIQDVNNEFGALLGTPYVQDTLSQIFAGPIKLRGFNTEERPSLLGTTEIRHPRMIGLRTNRDQREIESTLMHELVHSADLRGEMLPDNIKKQILVDFWEKNPELKKLAESRFLIKGERSPEFLADRNYVENKEALAKAFQQAMSYIRSGADTLPNPEFAAPGGHIAYSFLKNKIK